MKSHAGSSAAVAEKGCGAIANLAVNNDNQEKFVLLGKLVSEAVRLYKADNSTPLQTTLTVNLLKCVNRFCSTLLFNSSLQAFH